MATENKTMSNILSKYISAKIPKYATNIFHQMFNGIEAMFTTLEYRLNVSKRERNMLTAQSLSSLRSLASENGFEPTLKIPAKGLLSLTITPKLFNRSGYPLFLKPYSVFTDSITKIQYIYIANKTLKLTNGTNFVPVVEGEIKTENFTAETGKEIERIYISEENLANNSIVIQSGGVEFLEVKSFVNHVGENDNKQFIIKFSNNPQTPIVIYVKGLELNDIAVLTYRLTFGENGNLTTKTNFETDDIVDGYNVEVVPDDDEITITNVSGFDFGSNGTDENALRAAIGFNHGSELLFDNISYKNFVNKYSTLLLQNVKSVEDSKTIKNIYISKKRIVINNENIANVISQYQDITHNLLYLFSTEEKTNISNILKEKEFALTSHNMLDAEINKYAFQITLESQELVEKYSQEIKKILYLEFSKFLYTKKHQINIELLFDKFMLDNDIKFEYTIFDKNNELEKINKNLFIKTNYIIKHIDTLPILKGDFEISDANGDKFQLFFDINVVSK